LQYMPPYSNTKPTKSVFLQDIIISTWKLINNKKNIHVH
jgi:hypothetical protein